MSFTPLTNEHTLRDTYKDLGGWSNNPFTEGIFVDDRQYVRFCANFREYVNMEPVFEDSSAGATLMYLGDIEIRYMQAGEGFRETQTKLLRRLRENVNKDGHIFLPLLSSTSLLNTYSPDEYNELVRSFLAIPESVYVTGHIEDTKWSRKRVVYDENPDFGQLCKTIIVDKNVIQEPCVCLYGNSDHWKYTRNYYLEYLEKLGNPQVVVCYQGDPLEGIPNLLVAVERSGIVQDDELGEKESERCARQCENVAKGLGYKFDPERAHDISVFAECRIVSASRQDPPVMSMKHLRDALFGKNKVLFHNELNPEHLQTTPDTVIVGIPSAVHVHGKSSSVLSSRERLRQTVRQIKTVRRKIPNSLIVLLELYPLDLEDLHFITPHLDIICLFYNDTTATSYATQDALRNRAEVHVLQHLAHLVKDKNFSHFIKFGGRYWLSRDFSIEEVTDPSRPCFLRRYAEVYKETVVEPVFYSIPKTCFETYLQSLASMSEVMSTQWLDVERCLSRSCLGYPNGIVELEKLEIVGCVAAQGRIRYV